MDTSRPNLYTAERVLTACPPLHSIVQVVNRCLDEEMNVFKATIQDVVDELEVRVKG